MHEHGVVHRDLKPNNILVSGDGQVLKITDFNVAKFCHDYGNYNQFRQNNYEMNTYTGTIAFRAPEMFLKKAYNESIDMWAAGCVLYTMLSGREPFYSE
jgi:serine/threonine protein kinase